MPNYDVLESTDSYHGTRIRSQAPTEKYKSNWELIWGNKENLEYDKVSQKRDSKETETD